MKAASTAPRKAASPVTWTRRSLTALRGLGADELRALLSRARGFGASGGGGDLDGRTVATMFFEDSTRTRTSFTLAAQRLGARAVDVSGAATSVNKGETYTDTARVVEAMGVDAIVVRAKQAGAADMVAGTVKCAVVSGGDGRHEHPTQGLLDAYTLAEAHDRLDGFDLSGLSVAIVGDVVNSRVARSAIAGMTALGAKAVCVGPPGLAPDSLAALGCTVSHDFDAILPTVDAVMMLRIQFERHGEGPEAAKQPGIEQKKTAAIASIREYREFFALTEERAARMKPGAVVMHPGPINRGLELDSTVADGPRSVILKQVANGVPVRMAALTLCVAAC